MDSQDLARVIGALEVVHAPTSPAEARQDAQRLLDALKLRDDAALLGHTLATPRNAGIIRHYGLTLLQHAINHQFPEFTEDKMLAVREWIVELASNIQASDPHYIKEKLAYLWVALAKRVWGLDTRVDRARDDVYPLDGWKDMDGQLLALWNVSNAGREFSAAVLRTLFEDLYLLDDPVAAKRSAILSAQCTEIVTPSEDLAQVYDARVPQLQELRADDDGWLKRWGNAVRELTVNKNEGAPLILTKILETLKACLYWVIPRSIVRTNILEYLLAGFEFPDINVRIIACDNLHILFTRTYPRAEDFDQLVGQIFLPEGVSWLARIYDGITIDENDIDDIQYVYLKKVIELIVGLGDYLHAPQYPLPEQADYTGYFQLMVKIARHPSLLASGSSLQFWCSLLRIEELSSRPEVEALLPTLLEIAAERCVNYANFPQDHISQKFMEIDFDSGPEATGFYNNYRKYMEDVVRLIVCRIPISALNWLHEIVSRFFQSQLGWQAMNEMLINHSAPAYILATGQITVVESAIRGVSRWQLWATESDKEQHTEQILNLVAEWAQEMLGLQVKDTVLHRKIIECLVQFAPLLKQRNQIIFSILERVLTSSTWEYPNDDPENDDERERVRDLRTASGTELNRLAYMIPESLVQIYGDLERVISDLLGSGKVREHESISFKSFLLVVSQRSSLPNKSERFSAIVDPVLSSWTEDSTMKGLADLEWFMERVGIVRIAEYFRSRGITADTNLLETPMDDAGRALKLELKQKWQAIFPIRPSRIFIQYTIERLEHTSPEYLHLLDLWKPRIQPILPHILQLISQIVAYHNPENWVNLPPEVRTFVKVSTQERFWQAGVSMQTRDEFETQSIEAAKTLRDFADSVGHIIRYTREYAFLTLGSVTQLEGTMFEIEGIGQQVFNALAGGNTVGVTSHSWRHMISLVVRNAIKNCPAQYLERFMVEFVPPFLHKITSVLAQKWQVLSESGFQLMEDDIAEREDDLSEEMMDEHLLRQLTAIVVRLLMDLAKHEPDERKRLIKSVSMSQKKILFAILKLASTIMLFKDSRCCFNTCLLVTNILANNDILESDEVAQFFCAEIVPSCVRVLSDPYFHESHNEVGNILALMYGTLKSRRAMPLLKLQELIPELDVAALEELQETLDQSTNFKQQRGILLDFLSTYRVLHNDEESRARNRRRAEHRVSRRNDNVDQYDGAAMISMFGDA